MKNKFYVAMLFSISVYTIGYTCESAAVDQTWQEVQSTVRDAVVQVFATSKTFSWFNPHVVPSAHTLIGTGFFINKEGQIVTCAHVVEKACSVYIAVPSLGKQRLKAHVISLCPQHDIALLQLDEKAVALVHKTIGDIKYLHCGNSDTMHRGEEIISLGYPVTTIETEQLKGTVGVISARLNSLFQYDAPTNPDNSGGPILNRKAEVVGITTSQMKNNVQNSNFAIPINTFKSSLPALYEHRLLKVNGCGIMWTATTEEARKYFNCPDAHGCLVCDVNQTSIAGLAGIQVGDIIYEVDGYSVDNYGEIKALCDDEKMLFDSYINQCPVNQTVNVAVYREGMPLNFSIYIHADNNDAIPVQYPAYENIEYEIFAGMIVMPLTKNYINDERCVKYRPGLQRYLTNLYNNGQRLIVVNIFSDSYLYHTRTLHWANTINEINGEPICTLDDFRSALKKSIDTGIVIIKTTDEEALSSDNMITILPLYESCKETVELSHVHRYPLSPTVTELIRQVDASLLDM